MLNHIKWQTRFPHWLLLLAMVFTAQAFGRIIQDTSWTASPKRFISTAIVAGVFWLAFLVATLRLRRLGP